jgi:capsular polysaccharide biosynthesis protein
MTILYDGCVSRRTPPRNLRPEDAPLFAHELERTIDPMRAIELANVSANGEGLLFRRGRILRESFAVAEIYERARKRRLPFLVRNYLLRRRRKLSGRFLWITDDWSNGYFHWLADALPRLFAARDLASAMTLLLPAKCDLDFVRASLQLFDIAGIEYVAPREVSVIDQLVVPTHSAQSGSFNDPLMRELRGFVLDSYGIDRPATAHRRIYISRSRALKRRITNEDEVIAVLHDFDFEIVHFEDHSFEEQVRIAAATSLMVSNHGAGLTNMLFMRAGGRVLELRRASERERNCFFNLATTARLDYYYQSCPQERTEDSPHSANVVVDVRGLRENLALMLRENN